MEKSFAIETINKICTRADICTRFVSTDECPADDPRVNTIVDENGELFIMPFDNTECMLLSFFVAYNKIDFVEGLEFNQNSGLSEYACELMVISNAIETASMVYDIRFTDDTVRWAIEKAATLQR